MKPLTLLIIHLVFWNYCYSQNCKCPDYEFSSSKNKPLIEVEDANSTLLVCGYTDVDLDNGFRSGIILKDSSIYLSGFSVFACSNSIKPLISMGETQIFKLKPSKRYLTMELIMNLPIEKGLKYNYTSVIKYKIAVHNGNWNLEKPIKSLSFSSLTENDFFKIKKDLGWEKLYPEHIFNRDENYEENRITYAFILSLKEYPKFNKDFENLKTENVSVSELHDQMVQILKDLK